jgi:two-component system CheB/CheR fusion protein
MPTATTPPEQPAGSVPSPLTFPVVGIGGSAGGLQAVLAFFRNMPVDPDMAFVVILHLSRDHESNAAAIIQRVTSMPVSQVTSSVAIEANHVYVIATGADLSMNDGHLDVSVLDRGHAVAIDVFFRTLAQVHGSRAVSIVMSGTGSDGAVGLTRVKEEGGITMAQSPMDAEHDDMPRAAVATGMVDFVLEAASMGTKLVELSMNALQIRRPERGEAGELPDDVPNVVLGRTDKQVLQEIMSVLRAYTGHDFRHYKPGTVMRRLERRLQINGLPDLQSYLLYLQRTPQEAAPLLQDMLISVTSFFRDVAAFDALEQEVLPRLFRDRDPNDQVRVWVAGCATGEESYSISMLLQEQAESATHSTHADFQIFATDIDDRAIAAARRGLYPSGIAVDLTAARLERFLIKEQDQYRVTAASRERVLFATHNLLRDPPFSRLDLICCRNLLIYLDQSAQASVLQMFRYALKPGGYLFLGTSESADAAGNLFTAIDKKNRIFRMDAGGQSRGYAAYLTDRAGDSLPVLHRRGAREAERSPQQSALAQQHLQALQSISPASVLIDEEHEILHLSSNASRFMERNAGVVSNNLLNNVGAELRLELRTALFKAAQSGAKVVAQVRRLGADGDSSTLRIEVHPIADSDQAKRVLVVFSETTDVAAEIESDRGEGASATHFQMLGNLEEDNRQLKLDLQDTLERSALSNEELKASNEELQAINEELRSATEELETSKEELQSMNEELGMVNIELRSKVEERGQINDDLQNLISSSGIATVFVDSGMRIKRFTPQASKLFSLIASDLGRSLLDITSRLNYGELATDAATVFDDLKVIERQITTNDDRHFLARILPYRTVDDKIGGAVLTFVDVTELRAARERAAESEERLQVAVASTSDFAIITTNEAGSIETWNVGAVRVFGYSAAEAQGHPISLIFTEQDRLIGLPQAEMRIALETGRAEQEGWRRRKDGSTIYCSGVMTRLHTSAGTGFSKIARDLTGSKQQELAQENLLLKEQQVSLDARRAVEMKDRFLAVMSHELKQPLNIMQVSAELLTRLPETQDIDAVIRIGKTIQRAVSSQTKIINDLLDLSRIRTGKLRLDIGPVDLSGLIRSLAAAAAGDFVARDIALEVECEDEVVCHCDKVRAEQVFWNLIANAIKFTPKAGSVRIGLAIEGNFAKVSVADTGLGIEAAFLPTIFDMFNQADSQSAPVNSGLGIGLALVKEIVQAHGGRVEAASEGLGRGSVFTVWMPVQAQDSIATQSTAGAGAALKDLRILAVDDDSTSLDTFAALLQLEGAVVDTAASAARGLRLLAANSYDLLISDLSMPEMDGFAFIAQVRRDWPGSDLNAIALSGYGRAVDVSRASEAGFDAHLSKPASIDDLKSMLAKLSQNKSSSSARSDLSI